MKTKGKNLLKKPKSLSRQQKRYKGTPYGKAASMPTNAPSAIAGGPKGFTSWYSAVADWSNLGVIKMLNKLGGTRPNSASIIKRKRYFAGNEKELTICYQVTVLQTCKKLEQLAKGWHVNDRRPVKKKRERNNTLPIIHVV